MPSLLMIGLLACNQTDKSSDGPTDEAIDNPPSEELTVKDPVEPFRPSPFWVTEKPILQPDEPFALDAPNSIYLNEAVSGPNFVCTSMFAYDSQDTSVNFRDSPDGNVIKSLPNLTRLQPAEEGSAFVERKRDWNYVYIMENRELGYVWGELIYQTAYTVQDADGTGANLLTADGDVIHIPNRTYVEFLGAYGDGDLIKVSSIEMEQKDRKVGYIASSQLMMPGCN